MIVLGLDLSCTSTGWVHFNCGTGEMKVGVINGKLPSPVTRQMQIARLGTIQQSLLELMPMFGLPDLVLIEDYAYSATGSDVAQAELGGVIRLTLHERGYRAGERLLIVGTSQLKKFACGTGNAKKDLIRTNVDRRWGFNRDDVSDDVYDAYVMARIGQAIIMDLHQVRLPWDLTKPMRDVIDQLTSQPIKSSTKGKTRAKPAAKTGT